MQRANRSFLHAVVHNVATEAQLVTDINASNLAGPADDCIHGEYHLNGASPVVTNIYLINGSGQTFKHSSFLRSQIDLRMIKEIRLKNVCISPSLRVGWLLDVSI